MAAKTFTLTLNQSNQTSAGQALDSTTNGMAVYGSLNGGDIYLENSKDNTNWVPVTYFANEANNRPGTYAAFHNVSLTGGWYVRVTLANALIAVSAPNVTVVIE